MASLAQMRSAARALGVPAAAIRAASTTEALSKAIENHLSGNSTSTKAPVKKAASTAAASTPAPAKSRGAKAKRPVTARPKTTSENGRNSLGDVDFTQTDGWNAREGSAPDRIVKALKRFRGDREKVFEFL